MAQRPRDPEPERVLGEDDEIPEGARVVERKTTIEKFAYDDEPIDQRDPRHGRR